MTTPRPFDSPVAANSETAPDSNSGHVTADALSQYRTDFGSHMAGQSVNFKSVLGEPARAAISDPVKSVVSTPAGPVIGSKFGAEGELLASIPANIGQGIKDSAKEAWEHLGRTSFETVSGLALGAGFCLLSKNPSPAIKLATTWAGRAFVGIAAVDLGSRFARPMSDVWAHPENLNQDKKVLGDNLGDAVFNYSLAVGGGVAGAGLGEKYLATTRLGEILQGFKETDVSAEALGKLVADPTKAHEPLARMANAFSRRAAGLDATTGASGTAGGTTPGEMPFTGSMRLRTMADGSQIGSTGDGSLMVMTKDGTALYFKNNRSMFGLRNKLDLAKVMHQGGDETDVLTGMYSPTRVYTYGRPSGGAAGDTGHGPHFYGKDPAVYFDAPPPADGAAAGAENPTRWVFGKPSQSYTAKDGTKFETGRTGSISAVETGGNRVYLNNKGKWTMSVGEGPENTDFAGINLDPANFSLGSIPDRMETAKKGAEVGLTEIMLERGGDIGSSLIEHEVLVHTTKDISKVEDAAGDPAKGSVNH
jgi:hypothetical protein